MDNNNVQNMDLQSNDKSHIVQYYSGKSILITGATGIVEITLKNLLALAEVIIMCAHFYVDHGDSFCYKYFCFYRYLF